MVYLIIGLTAAYLLLFGQTIFLSINRQEILTRLNQLETAVAEQEANYLTRTSKIDPSLAAELGFIPSEEKIIFTSIQTKTVAVSPSGNEI